METKQIKFLKLLKKPMNYIPEICEKCGITDSIFSKWKEKDLKFKEELVKALKERREATDEFVEDQLFKTIEKGSIMALNLCLNKRYIGCEPKRLIKAVKVALADEKIRKDKKVKMIMKLKDSKFNQYLEEI